MELMGRWLSGIQVVRPALIMCIDLQIRTIIIISISPRPPIQKDTIHFSSIIVFWPRFCGFFSWLKSAMDHTWHFMGKCLSGIQVVRPPYLLVRIKVYPLWQCSNPTDKTPTGGQGASWIYMYENVTYCSSQKSNHLGRKLSTCGEPNCRLQRYRKWNDWDQGSMK